MRFPAGPVACTRGSGANGCLKGKSAMHVVPRSSSRTTLMFVSLILSLVTLFLSTSWGADEPHAESQTSARSAPNPLRNAYFGDIHVHTSYSLDAYALGNRNDPRAAYRFGRGETIALPGGAESHLQTPLR